MKDKRVFIDSNIAIYAYSKNDHIKRQTARNAIINNDCFISSQVLNEFCNVCLKKLKISVDEVLICISDLLSKCSFVSASAATAQKALLLHKQHQFSFYDALIIASAVEYSCAELFSEDLQDGRIIDGTIIVNIFKTNNIM